MITIQLTKQQVETLLRALYMMNEDWIESDSKQSVALRRQIKNIENKIFKAIPTKALKTMFKGVRK